MQLSWSGPFLQGQTTVADGPANSSSLGVGIILVKVILQQPLLPYTTAKELLMHPHAPERKQAGD